MRILIKKGRILNPDKNDDFVGDILVENDIIVKKASDINEDADEIIDADGCFVMPGLIDLHVHFRDPGFEYKETLKTGAEAAAKGGFTSVCTMPNTKPVMDSPERVREYVKRAEKEAVINVLPVGAVTIGQNGEELTDIKGMKESGICAISEDGKSVMNAELYREAMKIAAECGIPVMAHCEDKNMVNGGVMNESGASHRLGMKGISNAVEDVIVARDILIAKETGATLHLCHCSTKDSVRMTKAAKEDGLKVTAEVCPHHFTLCDEDIVKDDANYKMNPPLRAKEDVEALKEGLKENIMDVISTDHAPHSAEEKKKSISESPFGIVGLETSVALTITELVSKGIITPLQMAEKMSYNPAKVLGIDKGTLNEGKTADITIINPEESYVIDSSTFVSKGKNTPFNGYKVKGAVKYTICNGNVVYRYI